MSKIYNSLAGFKSTFLAGNAKLQDRRAVLRESAADISKLGKVIAGLISSLKNNGDKDITYNDDKIGDLAGIKIVGKVNKDVEGMIHWTITTKNEISDEDFSKFEDWVASKGYEIPAAKESGKKKILLITGKPKELKESKEENSNAKTRNRSEAIFDNTSKLVKDNKDHFPIDTEKRAHNALAQMGKFKDVPEWFDGSLEKLKKIVIKAVKAKYPEIEIDVKKDLKESVDASGEVIDVSEKSSDDTIFKAITKWLKKWLREKVEPGITEVDNDEKLGGEVVLTRSKDELGDTFGIHIGRDISEGVRNMLDGWVESQGFVVLNINDHASSYFFGLVAPDEERIEESKCSDKKEPLEEAKKDEDEEEMTIEKAAEFLKAAFDEEDLETLKGLLGGDEAAEVPEEEEATE